MRTAETNHKPYIRIVGFQVDPPIVRFSCGHAKRYRSTEGFALGMHVAGPGSPEPRVRCDECGAELKRSE